MNDDSDLYPAYIVSHEAWYNSPPFSVSGSTQAIDVMQASTGGGVKWEFRIERVRDIGIQIQIFDDAWDAFVEFPDLFRELQAIAPDVNLDEVRDVLERLGFKDDTQREQVTA